MPAVTCIVRRGAEFAPPLGQPTSNMESPMTQKAWTTVRSATLAVGRLMREASRVRLNQLAAIFFLSGVAGLIYELLWMRILSLTFGVTSYAVSTGLAG